jgi:hypothetical protein
MSLDRVVRIRSLRELLLGQVLVCFLEKFLSAHGFGRDNPFYIKTKNGAAWWFQQEWKWIGKNSKLPPLVLFTVYQTADRDDEFSEEYAYNINGTGET